MTLFGLEDLADVGAAGCFAGGAALDCEPAVEIGELYFALHGGFADFDGFGAGGERQAVDPFLLAQAGDAAGDGFVERGGGDLGGVFDGVHIGDGDAEGAGWHGGDEDIIFAFCSLQSSRARARP